MLTKEYSDAAYYPVDQLTVNAYAVQHPGAPSRRSIQSVAVHLVSLCGVVERGFDFRQVFGVKRRLMQQDDDLVWLEPPAALGEDHSG